MECSNCHAEITEEDKFCPECGLEFVDEKTPVRSGESTQSNGSIIASYSSELNITPIIVGIVGVLLILVLVQLYINIGTPITLGLTVLAGIGAIVIIHNNLHRNPRLIGYSYGLLAFIFLLTPIFLAPTDANPYMTMYGLLQAAAGILYLGSGILLLSRRRLEDTIGLQPVSVTVLGIVLYALGFVGTFIVI